MAQQRLLFLLTDFVQEAASNTLERIGQRLFIESGVSNIEREPQAPGIEFSMAFVGPLVSLLIGALCYSLLFLLRGNHSSLVPILTYLAFANILLGIFNLVPGFPLDGGRVLHSIIWKINGNAHTATNIATIIGQGFACLFILYGILQFFYENGFTGLLIAFTGWFLLSAAHTARIQSTLETTLAGVLVGQVMTNQHGDNSR